MQMNVYQYTDVHRSTLYIDVICVYIKYILHVYI